jgi:hypothetical protein
MTRRNCADYLDDGTRCGSARGYLAHIWAGIPACQPCIAAWRAFTATAQPVPDHPSARPRRDVGRSDDPGRPLTPTEVERRRVAHEHMTRRRVPP